MTDIPRPPSDPDDPNWWYLAPGCQSLLIHRDPLADDDDSEGLCADHRCRCDDEDCECHQVSLHVKGPYSEGDAVTVSDGYAEDLPAWPAGHRTPTGW